MQLPIYFDEQEQWNRALMLYDSVLREINTKLEILSNEFKLDRSYNPIEHITSRIKSRESIARKIHRKEKELTVENIVRYVNDVAGIRIICSFTSDIYLIADAISKQNDVTVLQIKDYIANPKPNGYSSYHMIVSIPIFLSNEIVDTKVEIQIRTIAMDFWASLEHKIYYKFEGKAPDGIKEQLRECASIITFLDKKMLSINENVQNYHEAILHNAMDEKQEPISGEVVDKAPKVISSDVVDETPEAISKNAVDEAPEADSGDAVDERRETILSETVDRERETILSETVDREQETILSETVDREQETILSDAVDEAQESKVHEVKRESAKKPAPSKNRKKDIEANDSEKIKNNRFTGSLKALFGSVFVDEQSN